MAKAFLRVNAEINLDGERYVVERRCTDGVWVLKQQQTGRLLERTTVQIFDALADGSLTFRSKQLGSIVRPTRRESDLAPEKRTP